MNAWEASERDDFGVRDFITPGDLQQFSIKKGGALKHGIRNPETETTPQTTQRDCPQTEYSTHDRPVT